MTDLPEIAPAVTLETRPFWDATAEGRLILPRCNACSTVIWYPRLFCPSCASDDVSWVDAAGTGTVYSFTVVRKGQGPFAPAAPYVLAYVELDEGPRVMTNIVGCRPDDVTVGQRVVVTFADTGEATALYRFRPADR
ncbi:MAG: Zn-ribbon domain-containing OB-fold protein [Acidimicrobiales bacterium]|nr:Zn-ribbon domain-containing OB-fold protein [Acidimicrobiales bacterium]